MTYKVDYYVPPGSPFPLMVDTASRIYGAALQASQYNAVSRYLTDGNPDLIEKLLTYDEAQDYLNHNQGVVSNYETTADMMTKGYSGGQRDAQAAWSTHKACGGPDFCPIYFSCDFDASEADDIPIEEYINGLIAEIGDDCVGIYGDFYVLTRARSVHPELYMWQTEAWSGGQILDNLHLYQRNDLGIATINDRQCDVDEIRNVNDYGQWNTRLDGWR